MCGAGAGRWRSRPASELRVAVAIEAETTGRLPATGESVQAAVAAALEATTGRRPVVDVTIEAVHA